MDFAEMKRGVTFRQLLLWLPVLLLPLWGLTHWFIVPWRQEHALFDAVREEDVPRVRHLLAHGADPNSRVQRSFLGGPLLRPQDRDTPLHAAAAQGQPEIIRLLLSAGADPNAAAALRETPLVRAVRFQRHQAVSLLLAAGANVNAPTALGDTPLHSAARLHEAGLPDVRLVRELLEAGADINARNGEGYTPLMFAARELHVDIVRVLLQRGADPATRHSHHRRTAAMLAQENEESGKPLDPDRRRLVKAVVQMLKQAEAQSNR